MARLEGRSDPNLAHCRVSDRTSFPLNSTTERKTPRAALQPRRCSLQPLFLCFVLALRFPTCVCVCVSAWVCVFGCSLYLAGDVLLPLVFRIKEPLLLYFFGGSLAQCTTRLCVCVCVVLACQYCARYVSLWVGSNVVW